MSLLDFDHFLCMTARLPSDEIIHPNKFAISNHSPFLYFANNHPFNSLLHFDLRFTNFPVVFPPEVWCRLNKTLTRQQKVKIHSSFDTIPKTSVCFYSLWRIKHIFKISWSDQEWDTWTCVWFGVTGQDIMGGVHFWLVILYLHELKATAA